jgi:hypothetical protein
LRGFVNLKARLPVTEPRFLTCYKLIWISFALLLLFDQILSFCFLAVFEIVYFVCACFIVEVDLITLSAGWYLV